MIQADAYTYPIASVKYILITARVSLGASGRYRRHYDLFGVTDSVVFSAGKNPSESVSALENLALTFGTQISEATIATADEAFRSFGLTKSEDISTADVKNVSFNAQQSELLGSSDGQTFVYGLEKPDALGVADSDAKTLWTTYTEAPVSVDASSIGVYLTFLDTVSTSDVLVTGGYANRAFSDALYATDDFLGEANIDDDQIMVFTKNTVDPLSAADSFSRLLAYSRGLTDQPSTADVSILEHSTPRSDGSQISDAEVKLLGPVRSDSANTSDSGSLLSQGYVDNPYYFAEDYVGQIRYID
jgi:hypothetical protein